MIHVLNTGVIEENEDEIAVRVEGNVFFFFKYTYLLNFEPN